MGEENLNYLTALFEERKGEDRLIKSSPLLVRQNRTDKKHDAASGFSKEWAYGQFYICYVREYITLRRA